MRGSFFTNGLPLPRPFLAAAGCFRLFPASFFAITYCLHARQDALPFDSTANRTLSARASPSARESRRSR